MISAQPRQTTAHVSGALPRPLVGSYRHELWRIWDRSLPIGAFIGLNPSTATAETDDHTIRKEIGFATRWGWGGFYKFNLFAFRSTDPKGMWAAEDPVGPSNDEAFAGIKGRGFVAVVAAWGAFKHRRATARIARVLAGPLRDVPLWCIGEPTPDGYPRHPLMLGYERTLRVWRAGRGS